MKRKRLIPFFLVLLLALFLSGCGSNGSGDDSGSDLSDKLPLPVEPRNIKDQYYTNQWSLNPEAVNFFGNSISSEAHIHGYEELRRYTGKKVRVAVIDDGLDFSHEDLEDAVDATYNLTRNSNQLDPIDSSASHGTAVTGIIAARENNIGIKGVAPESKILFIEYNNQMTDSEMLLAYKKAEAFGADIINCSWGTYDVSPVVKEEIQRLANEGREGKGIPIIYATGNSNRSMENDESAIPEVIAVSSSNEYNERASYSNYGPELDILAPGGEWLGITTLDPMGINGISPSWQDPDYLLADDTSCFKGTSAAAPIITGVIAILLEINPDLTRKEISEILRQSADKVGAFSYINGRNDYYGYGKVNLSKAVKLVLDGNIL